MTNVITLVEAFLGEDLTPATAARLADAPIEQLEQLTAAHLAPFYYDWLEQETAARGTDTTPVYHGIDPYPREPRHDRAHLDRVKALLLYFPRVAVADPLADLLWPAITAAQLRGLTGDAALIIEETESFKTGIGNALRFLADVKPLTAEGDVRLLPATFALDYSVIQDRTRDEIVAFQSLSADLKALYPEKDEGIIGAVKAWGWICADCDYTPVAGTHWVKDVLRADIEVQRARGKEAARAGLPRIDFDVAATLSADGLPGVSQAPLEDIVKLRRNEEAFDEWRRDLREVLRLVWESEPGSPEAFEVEFAQAVEDRLKPRIEALAAKTKATSPLTKLLLPAALTVGGGVLTATLFPSAAPLLGGVPATAVAGAASGAVGWVGEQLYTRFKKAGRRAASLRHFYGHFIETTGRSQ